MQPVYLGFMPFSCIGGVIIHRLSLLYNPETCSLHLCEILCFVKTGAAMSDNIFQMLILHLHRGTFTQLNVWVIIQDTLTLKSQENFNTFLPSSAPAPTPVLAEG